MPALIGPVQILTIGGGVTHFGDTLIISPKNAVKSFNGAGGGNTGAFIITTSVISLTNTIDPNVVDQPILGNN
ncbi:spore germination protein [Mangrovibacillus cuniculi]|uniref:Spore germination protein n=1 Tax=Mangrovibacillus cuniculi TaxID=2593652 RepID=A0A7S8HF05_9BACI|nr:spore germination protein [Mangrovibacillus cuniculi]QPC46026.1 spore germination protein [Mangrovibacillus cuniculi]